LPRRGAAKTEAKADFRTIRERSEGCGKGEPSFPNDPESREIEELENEIRDLQITNKAKDIVIGQMQKERTGFFDQLLAANRKVGELETKLLQIEDSKLKGGS